MTTRKKAASPAEEMATALAAVEGAVDAATRCAQLTYESVTPGAGSRSSPRRHDVANQQVSHAEWARQVKAARQVAGSRRGFGPDDSRYWYRAGEMLANGEAENGSEAYRLARLEMKGPEQRRKPAKPEPPKPAEVAKALTDPNFAERVIQEMPDLERDTVNIAIVNTRADEAGVKRARAQQRLDEPTPALPAADTLAGANWVLTTYGTLWRDLEKWGNRLETALQHLPPDEDHLALINQQLGRILELLDHVPAEV